MAAAAATVPSLSPPKMAMKPISKSSLEMGFCKMGFSIPPDRSRPKYKVLEPKRMVVSASSLEKQSSGNAVPVSETAGSRSRDR